MYNVKRVACSIQTLMGLDFSCGNRPKVDVIRSYGYDAEEFSVNTEDGYILTLTHIKSSKRKLPVLMMHGVLSSSQQWVCRGPKEDLAFILADNGYDVWLGDLRGNVYSKNHSNMNPSEENFWNFSFHETGMYDVPALVDTVLQKSGSKQLFYVGHSMGTSVYYVMCTLRPEYNERIRMAVHLSPVAFGRDMKDMSFMLQQIMNNADSIAESFRRQNKHEFIVRTPMMRRMVDDICKEQSKRLCLLLTSQIFGPETYITNITKLHSYLQTLSGTSVKTMLHLIQLFKSKNRNFVMYDYGKERNLEMYKEKTPPAYPLERVTSPVALYYSDMDSVLDESTINRLKRVLPNVVTSSFIPGYNHIDLLWADNAPQLLYKKMIKLLNKF